METIHLSENVIAISKLTFVFEIGVTNVEKLF